MKVARISLPLSALLVIALNQGALAGPQSLLDPYATIKAPPGKAKLAAKKPLAAPRVVPTSVTIGGAPILPGKHKAAPAEEKAPPPLADGSSGFFAETKSLLHGIAGATKKAFVVPGKKIAGGTKGLGSKMADGAKNSGGFMAKGVKSVGEGFKSVGGKMKDGTEAVGSKMAVVPKKMGEGLKFTGDKMKDGSVAAGRAIVAVPKMVGGGAKATGEKIAEGTGSVGGKVKDGGESVGGKLVAMPKAVGKGIAGAAVKTGEATKRVAAAPLGFFGKLNPFHHKDVPAPVATAAKPAAQEDIAK